MPTLSNPILPGFNPDPSLCRVGKYFYLATSSFSYFPGIPIYRSEDLANWEQIGSVLDRPDQIDLRGVEHSMGIFAPTIRHHEGTFYVICTNVTRGGNFYVTAKDPAGPWSDPIWLEDAEGIDPSFFFDEDGRCWYCGTRELEDSQYYGNNEIWLQELDLKTKKLIGPRHSLWQGALRKAVWPEGPHIYRHDGYYYLMISEGGTDMDHAITIARSEKITGPYVGRKSNPILTHRHLGRKTWATKIGHGELFDDTQGNWWMICLGSRPENGVCPLGRETFLVPFRWEEGWPLPDTVDGLVPHTIDFPQLKAVGNITYSQNAQGLSYKWLGLRNPVSSFYQVQEGGNIRLNALPGQIGDTDSLSFLGQRQLTHNFSLSTRVDFHPHGPKDVAGTVFFQSDDFHLRLQLENFLQSPQISVIKREKGEDSVIKTQKLSASAPVVMEILVKGGLADLSCRQEGEEFSLARGINTDFLSTEKAGGFVGNLLGHWISSSGEESSGWAEFDSSIGEIPYD